MPEADARARDATRSSWAGLWPLDPAVDNLNHGSFGSCPKAILERRSELRARLEREPVEFRQNDGRNVLTISGTVTIGAPARAVTLIVSSRSFSDGVFTS